MNSSKITRRPTDRLPKHPKQKTKDQEINWCAWLSKKHNRRGKRPFPAKSIEMKTWGDLLGWLLLRQDAISSTNFLLVRRFPETWQSPKLSTYDIIREEDPLFMMDPTVDPFLRPDTSGARGATSRAANSKWQWESTILVSIYPRQPFDSWDYTCALPLGNIIVINWRPWRCWSPCVLL